MNLLESFLSDDREGVFIIGHASALVRVRGDHKMYNILLDPVWNHKPYGKFWEFHPPQFDCDSILHLVDACMVSHIHEDHVCDDILKRLECPVYIMGGRPALAKRLSYCKRLCEVIPETPFALFEDEAIGAYFVKHDFNTIDSSAFVFSETFTAYHGNDNFLSPESAQRLAKLFPTVDVALVPYAFIHWYPHLMTNMTEEEKRSEVDRLNKQSIDQAEAFVSALKPKIAVPFGSSLFYCGGRGHPLNRFLAKPHDFKSAHTILAGGLIYKHERGGLNCHGYMDKFWYHDLLKRIPDIEGSELDCYFDLDDEVYLGEAVDAVYSKLKVVEPLDEPHVLGINGIFINLKTFAIYYYFIPAEEQAMNKTCFNFDRPIFEKWVAGKITFEQAIGTRRFECTRVPNIYNLKIFEFMNKHL